MNKCRDQGMKEADLSSVRSAEERCFVLNVKDFCPKSNSALSTIKEILI
jgi:hypothetical protein